MVDERALPVGAPRFAIIFSLPSELHQHTYPSTILQCFYPLNRKEGVYIGRNT